MFLAYAPQLPFTALDQLLIVAFYARKDTRTPVLVGVVTVVLYLASALALIGPLDVAGLALANAIQNSVHGLILLVLLQRAGVRLVDGAFLFWRSGCWSHRWGSGLALMLAGRVLLPYVTGASGYRRVGAAGADGGWRSTCCCWRSSASATRDRCSRSSASRAGAAARPDGATSESRSALAPSQTRPSW